MFSPFSEMNMIEKNTIGQFTFLFDATILADDRSFDGTLLSDLTSLANDTISTDLHLLGSIFVIDLFIAQRGDQRRGLNEVQSSLITRERERENDLSIGFEIGENVFHSEQLSISERIITSSVHLLVVAEIFPEDLRQVAVIVEVRS